MNHEMRLLDHLWTRQFNNCSGGKMFKETVGLGVCLIFKLPGEETCHHIAYK